MPRRMSSTAGQVLDPERVDHAQQDEPLEDLHALGADLARLRS